MIEMELWVDVLNYEGLYQVSNLGRVRSLTRTNIVKQARYHQPIKVTRPGRDLIQHKDGKGYLKVTLCKRGRVKQFNVHRLVAAHFIDNPAGKPAINHIDADHLNNRATNLEWCTIQENNRHTISLDRKPHTYSSYFSAEDRRELNKLFDLGVCVSAISDQLGLPYHSVRYVHRLRNKRLKTPVRKNLVELTPEN